ncbi:Ger(x)C family spore germination protein [Sutcliffiella halmapala]|uniref:Ger(x)C family spore germination protein n=1 Tax=Sutcliffiella halmapala TaxID=79882 RepID=UPI0014761120|nr:Ger(x)C family spore germination protein [Sutcliffiella halmapala]
MYFNKLGIILIITFLAFPLSGCFGLKNIQDLTYVVSIGAEFLPEEEQYKVYLQALDFSNVAKQEAGKETGEAPIWHGEAQGNTLNLAVSDLYHSAQPPLYFGHLRSIILGDKLVTTDLDNFLANLGRNRSIRHNSYIFATHDVSIHEILQTNALFEYPPIYTILHNPEQLGDDSLYVHPFTLREVLINLREPYKTLMLPSIAINRKDWQKNDENYPLLYLNGVYVFHQKEYKGYLPVEGISGVRWINDSHQGKVEHVTEEIKGDKKTHTVIRTNYPELKIDVDTSEGYPKFTLTAKAKVEILEVLKEIPISKLQKHLEETYHDEIMNTFKKGLELEADLYNLGTEWYQYHQAHVKKFEKEHESSFYLNEDSIKEIKFEVQLIHSNSLKFEY